VCDDETYRSSWLIIAEKLMMLFYDIVMLDGADSVCSAGTKFSLIFHASVTPLKTNNALTNYIV
jgi:hypothetical protein